MEVPSQHSNSSILLVGCPKLKAGYHKLITSKDLISWIHGNPARANTLRCHVAFCRNQGFKCECGHRTAKARLLVGCPKVKGWLLQADNQQRSNKSQSPPHGLKKHIFYEPGTIQYDLLYQTVQGEWGGGGLNSWTQLTFLVTLIISNCPAVFIFLNFFIFYIKLSSSF